MEIYMNYLGHNLETMAMELSYGNLNGWCVSSRSHKTLECHILWADILRYC